MSPSAADSCTLVPVTCTRVAVDRGLEVGARAVRADGGSAQVSQDLLDGLDGDRGGIPIDVVPGAGHHADLPVRSRAWRRPLPRRPNGSRYRRSRFLFGVPVTGSPRAR